MSGFTRTMVYGLTLIATGAWSAVGQASQGPGVGSGTASPSLQLAMAVVIYGGAALALLAAVFGAVRSAR